MKFNKIHDDHDLLMVTPQYFKFYEEAIKKHYPHHKIEISDMVHQGQAYLFNEEKLRQEYQKKMNENINT